MAEEEIDAWDDWETAADAGLADFKKPIVKKQVPIVNKQPPLIIHHSKEEKNNEQLWEKANEYSTPTIIRTDTVRTQYQPEIKILKRSPNKPKGPRLPEDNDTQPIKKTLAEREKDYLLARERIFGEKSQ